MELLRYPQEGKEDSLQQIDKALKLIQSYASKENPGRLNNPTRLAKDWTHLFRGRKGMVCFPPMNPLTGREKSRESQPRKSIVCFQEKGIRVP